jgi:hypothetical protein
MSVSDFILCFVLSCTAYTLLILRQQELDIKGDMNDTVPKHMDSGSFFQIKNH